MRWSVSWSDIRGHDRLVSHFADLLRQRRFGHAYLFVGPKGVGKRRFAQQLARCLLCESTSDPAEACGQCPACMQVESGTHPDLIQVGRAPDKLELSIDVIREVSGRLALKSARGGMKVAIIDDADDMNDAAANAFLKTLEEPPPRSLLILLAADLETQLPTIVSRCQVIRFGSLPIAEVVEILRGQGCEEMRARRAAQISGGSPGQALALLDEGLWEFRQQLASQLAQRPCDPIALAESWRAFIESAGKDAAAQRHRAALSIRLLTDLLSQGLRAAFGALSVDADEDDRQTAIQLAARWDVDRLLALLDRCLDAEHQIDRRVQLALVIDALAASFA